MGALTSEKMKLALSLIMATPGGISAYAAAKQTGISRSAISQNREYRAHMEKMNNAQPKHKK